MRMTFSIMLFMTSAAAVTGCGDGTPDPQDTVEGMSLARVKALVVANIAVLSDGAATLRAAAPPPDTDGWNAATDAVALDAMKTQWRRVRTAYEHIEGAIAVLFPELDYATDERYDGFLGDHGPDTNLFDDQNVTGVHAIERILWSDRIPSETRRFEEALPGYEVAAFPATHQESDDFKNKLCSRLETDFKTMGQQFAPLHLDAASAFRGVIGSMTEQLEKAELAASGREESRYAAYTLADMRANVDAGVKTFDAFKPWLKSKMADEQIQRIDTAFARVIAAYATLPGDALPPVPPTWSLQQPSADDLRTPFGMLWSVLQAEGDAATAGSLVFEMNEAARILAIPQIPGS